VIPDPSFRFPLADDRRRPAPAPAAVIAVVAAVSAVLAIWMDLSPIHRFHDSDSLVPVLMSLQRWTPFYWEQNRFGMLVPLLALAVRGPYHNLLAQVALRLFAVVLSFFLVARAAVPRPYWPAVGAATLFLFIAGKGLFAHCFLQMQPYPQALALALGGLALLDSPLAGRRGAVRIAGAAVLVGLAFWVSPSPIFWLLSLLVLRWALGLEPGKCPHPPGPPLPPPLAPPPGEGGIPRGRGEGLLLRLLPFVLVGAGFGASLLVTHYADWASTDLGAAKAATWPHAWASLAAGSAKFLGRPLWIAAAVLAGTALFAVFVRRSRRSRRSPRARLAAAAGICLLGSAAVELLALGTSSWVHLNDLTIRFLCCGLLAAATALPAMLAILLLEGRERWHNAANAVALLALLPAVFLRFGPPSPAAARAAFERHVGRAAPAIVAAGCTHVIGSYWRVWPAVLRANEILWQRGGRRQIWGITARSRPTRDLWWPRSWATARVAVIRGDSMAAIARNFYEVPPLFPVEAPVAAASGVRVYSGAPPSGARVVSFPPLVRGPSEILAEPSREPRP
jgi:hypothetical protein